MVDADAGTLIAKSDIPVSAGLPTVESTKKWVAQQVPYKNYAGFSDAVDEAVRGYVENKRMDFRNRMGASFQRTAFNWASYNGEALTQEHEDDVSMPETRKALDSKTARIAEALFEQDPFMEVVGEREDLGQFKAYVIGAYVRRLMELGRFRDKVEPSAKDAELGNFSIIKVKWDRQFANVVNRKIDLRYEGDSAYYHDERRMRKALVKDHPKYLLVDPFWAIFDIDADSYEDLEYIGDESEQFLHALEQQAEFGLFPKAQVKKLRDRKTPLSTHQTDDTTGTDLVDQFRQVRSVALPGGMTDQNSGITHGARRVRTIELWAWFDFGDGWDGVTDPLGEKITGTHKVVITIASGVVLQFRLNPFDKKFVPYAIAMLNRSGHEMVASAPFDQVVVMNGQYDRFMSNAHRYMDLAVAPLIIPKNGSSLQGHQNLRELTAGSILPDGADFDVAKISDFTPAIPFMIDFFRREHEETSGALRVFESPQGTATETERKVQEQQRMVRSSIRAISEQWRQVALITYWMAGQFSTQRQRFQVVGKAASVLGKTFTITPDWLQEEIDVRFLGLMDLHTFGSRQTGLSMWSNRWGPLLPNMPSININALARMDFELSVGRAGISDIFPDDEPAWHSWPQHEENEMLLAGQEVPISKHDDDFQHIEEMAPLLDMARRPDCPTFLKNVILEHFQLHAHAYRRKQAEQQAQQREAQQKAQLQSYGGGEPGSDQSPVEGGLPAPTKMASTEGNTPGPPQGRTVAKSGRQGSGASQTMAMSGGGR